MATEEKPYQRLPGTGYRHLIPPWAMFLLFFVIGIFVLLFRGRRVQLWQGKEHLLLVEWDGLREYYKRFGYGDIQAFVVQKTREGMVVNGVLLAVILFWLVLGIAVPDTAGRIGLLSVAALFGLLLLVNFLSGPTCKCSVRTAVQVEELPSLGRLPRARKVLARLRPLIVAAQGQLVPEEIPAKMQEWTAQRATAASTANQARFVVDNPNAPPRILSE
jgi:hypothetical protein